MIFFKQRVETKKILWNVVFLLFVYYSGIWNVFDLQLLQYVDNLEKTSQS